MSQNAKENMELIYRAIIVVLFGMCSYYRYKVDNRVDETYEKIIRLEEQFKIYRNYGGSKS